MGSGGEGCLSVVFCQLYGSRRSILLVTLLVQDSSSKGRVNLGHLPKQGRCWRF